MVDNSTVCFFQRCNLAYMSKVDNGMVFEVWTLLSLVCECCKHMSRYMHDY